MQRTPFNQDSTVDPGAFQSPWSYGHTDGGFAFCLSAKRVTTAYLITASNRRQMQADEHFLPKKVISLTSKNKIFGMDIIDIYINIHKLWQIGAVFLHNVLCVSWYLPGAAKLGPIGPMASGEEVVIQTFSEELGTSGRSNFVPCREFRPPSKLELDPLKFRPPFFGGGENRPDRAPRGKYIVL